MTKKSNDPMIGKRFRTLYEHSEIVTVLKPAKHLPGDGWYVVRYEENHPGKCCMHRDMMAPANSI